MMREGRPIGAIAVLRPETGPFSDKEITLLQTFSDQAVIAIENVRLFNEIQEKSASSRLRTATSRNFSRTCRTSCARR